MPLKLTMLAVIVLFATSTCSHAVEPIFEIGVTTLPAAFNDAKRNEPLQIKSADEAAKYFGEGQLAKVKANVDFDEQFVLVFAWRGSGQDKLNYDVAESFPEQVTFRMTYGRTRDLRPHVYVYALRNNVKWSIAKGGIR